MSLGRIEILSIGDELLDGRVADTNTVRCAQALGHVGQHVQQRTTVLDDIDTIVGQACAIAERGTALCVVSGGLGPTSDDLTAAAFAKLLHVEMLRDAAQVAAITERLQRRGREITSNQLKQADIPSSATRVDNLVGTALGFDVTYAGCRFVALPGIPAEFDAMLETAVIAPLRRIYQPVARRLLYCFGMLEAQMDNQLSNFATMFPHVRLQFRVKLPEVHVTMHAANMYVAELDEAHAWCRKQLDVAVFSDDSKSYAEVVLELLRRQGATLSIAESCTGGLVADRLTDIPGYSDVFMLGVVAYSNDSKVALLDVPQTMIDTYGAVSEQVVACMSRAVRLKGDSTYGIATSGIAGPTGATSKKPVGTIWIGLSGPNIDMVQHLQLPYDRQTNKLIGGYAALDALRRHLCSL